MKTDMNAKKESQSLFGKRLDRVFGLVVIIVLLSVIVSVFFHPTRVPKLISIKARSLINLPLSLLLAIAWGIF